MKYYAIDFETYYDKGYGIEECGLYAYLNDKRFDAYLMSVWGEDIQWVGHPKDFKDSEEWDVVKDADGLLAHNAAFDRQVWDRCAKLGTLHAQGQEWLCTANLSVYVGGPRSLKDASKYLLGKEMSKEMRHYMKGKTWDMAVADGKDEQLKQYALDDAKNCYGLWIKYQDRWPECERRTAEITFEQTRRGVRVDTELLDKYLPPVSEARASALARIPWAGTKDENGDERKPLAALALKAWCKENGVDVPTTTNAKTPEFQKWQAEHADVDVVKAMQTYRSSNALFLKGTTLRTQVRPDGRYEFAMKYFGATTGRWAAGWEDDKADSTGFNLQNIIKDELFGLNLRKAIIAGPGKKFIVSDYSQIEPRCLAWLCEDKKFLDAIRAGVPLYEAHARASMGWVGGVLKKESPKLYALAKARVLALGYGAGWAKFIFMASMYGAAECLLDPIDDKQKQSFLRYIARTNQEDKVEDFKTDKQWIEAVNAWEIVMDFRASNPKIKELWARLEKDCWKCSGTDYKVELPSGRILPYFNVQTKGGLTCSKTLGEPAIKIWGGFLCENVTQATARDVMRDAIINLEDAGITTLFTVHDEIICEVDKNFDKAEIRGIMNQCPSWIEGLPLEIEQDETDYYKK